MTRGLGPPWSLSSFQSRSHNPPPQWPVTDPARVLSPQTPWRDSLSLCWFCVSCMFASNSFFHAGEKEKFWKRWKTTGGRDLASTVSTWKVSRAKHSWKQAFRKRGWQLEWGMLPHVRGREPADEVQSSSAGAGLLSGSSYFREIMARKGLLKVHAKRLAA